MYIQLILLKLSSFYINNGLFLHITDPHIDLEYKVGSPNQCILGKTGLGCCREKDIKLSTSTPAKKWGDYNCDLPIVTFNHTIDWIKNYFDNIDFILYGGDTVGHHDFSQSYYKNLNTIDIVNDIFNSNFKKIPILYTQGNHDTYPIDQTPPFITNKFRKAIINNDNDNFIKYGYYNLSISNNLSILSINSLDYDKNNLFSANKIINSRQDKWLKDILSYNNVSNIQTYILGHIYPTNSEAGDIYNSWLISYMNKYSNIIKGLFFGHSHKDQFKIVKNNCNIAPILITPSMMSDKRNPCFRIYKYNRYNNLLLDYYQYCVNISKSNIDNNINIYLDYQFNKEYGLNNITSLSYRQLLDNIVKNKTQAMKYCKKYYNVDWCNNFTINGIINKIYI